MSLKNRDEHNRWRNITNEQMGPLTELQITILPHWSATWWFRFIVLLLLVGVIFRFIRYFKIRQARFKRVMELKHEVLVY